MDESSPAGLARALRLIGRALRFRCPNCGRGRLNSGWFTWKDRCPVCGIVLEREEGYFLGAMLINLVMGELIPFGGMAAILIATWPNSPWSAIEVALPIAGVLFPVLLFPVSHYLWLALDWTIRPPEKRAGNSRAL